MDSVSDQAEKIVHYRSSTYMWHTPPQAALRRTQVQHASAGHTAVRAERYSTRVMENIKHAKIQPTQVWRSVPSRTNRISTVCSHACVLWRMHAGSWPPHLPSGYHVSQQPAEANYERSSSTVQEGSPGSGINAHGRTSHATHPEVSAPPVDTGATLTPS